MARAGWGSEIDDPFTFFELLSTGSAYNYGHYRSRDYDADIAAAMGSGPAERPARFCAAEKVVLRDLPIIPLFFYKKRALVGTRVSGWNDTGRYVRPSRYLALK